MFSAVFRRNLIGFCVGVSLVAHARFSSAGDRFDPERAKVIAAMLDPSPHGVGRPISDRDAWERLGRLPGVRTSAIANAERRMVNPVHALTDDDYLTYSKTGSAPAYMAEVDSRRFCLVLFVMAEGLENKGRFLPAIDQVIKAICSERTWVGPMHDRTLANFQGTRTEIDLLSSLTAWNLATADWLLAERLPAETRRLIREKVEQRVFAPFRAEARGEGPVEWWVTSPYNWNAVVHAGIVGAAATLIDSPVERAGLIAYAEQNVKIYLTGFKKDGYSPEGLGYWNYGFGHYTLLAETLLAATHGKINLYADERARLVAQLPRRLEIVPNVYPTFADCSVSDRPALWALHILDHRYGFGWQIEAKDRWISPTFSSSLAAVALNAFFEADAATVFPRQAADATPGPRLRDWMQDAQVYIGRPAPDRQGLGLAFKCGVNNEPHGHLDVGSYIVATGKQALLVDPGAPAYTAATFGPNRYDNPLLGSYGHDVPLVAGQTQKAGAEHKGTVVSTNFSDGTDTAILDLTKSYEVAALKLCMRKFEYDRAHQGAVTITDSAAFDSPQRFGTALVTLGQFREVRPGVVLVYQNHAALQVVIDTGGVPFTLKDELLDTPLKIGDRKARRLGIDLKTPVAAARISLRVTAVPAVILDPSIVIAGTLEAMKPDYKRAVTVLAANFTRQAGGAVVPITATGSEGGAIRLWKTDGHALTWKIRVVTAGTYGLQVRHCGDQDGDTGYALQIDGGAVGASGPFFLPPTGGSSNEGDDWETTWAAQGGTPATFSLTTGEHEITLINRGGNAYLDWLRLVPFDATKK